MVQNEEKLLKDYFDELSLEAAEVPEVKLLTAIRSGVHGSRGGRIPGRRGYFLGGLAVLAIVLMFAVPWIGGREGLPNSTIQSQLGSVHDWGEFEVFRTAVGSNLTVSSALDAGLVQRVNGTSAERSGYRLTVDGIAADQKGIIILYTLQNHTLENTRKFRISMVNDEDAMVDRYGPRSVQNSKPGITRGYQHILWDEEYTELPDRLFVKAGLYDENERDVARFTTEDYAAELSVPVALNQEALAKAGQTLKINQNMILAGQNIKINSVYFAVSGIYVEAEYDERNSKEIFGLISPQLMLGRSNDLTELHTKRSISQGRIRTLVFDNVNTSKEPLEMRINGIQALDKNAMELVIDTDKKQVIKGPDDRIKVSVNTGASGKRTMLLEVYPSKQRVRAIDDVNMILDEDFTDGSGTQHTTRFEDISVPMRKESTVQGAVPVLYYYNIGNEALPEPLTFKINSYPNPIKEQVSLAIRK